MFGDVTLIVREKDQAMLDLLEQIPTKWRPISLPRLYQSHKPGENRYDIRELALKNSRDAKFLKQFRDMQVFTPNIFTPPKIIVELNTDLLRFVKHCALSSGSKLKVRYELERGDNLYDEVVWIFNYLNSNLEITEQLYFEDHDSKKFGQVTKFRNGQVIFEELKPRS